MSDQQDPRKEQYERARDAFEALDIEDRTLFLVREAVNTIAAGVDTFARQLAEDLDAAFRPAEEADDEAPEAEGEPDAGEQPKARKTTKAKSTAKKNGAKTSAKKKSTKASGGKKTKGDKGADQADESDDDA